jgi:hypothetical protein
MLYKGKNVTLTNYKQLFKGYSADILDEIRSAILDETPITQYVESCKADSYKLNQLRLAKREGVPDCYLNTNFTAQTIFCVRTAKRMNCDISAILVYCNEKGLFLPSDTIEKLANAVLGGVQIEKVNFRFVPYALTEMVLRGLKRGFPMWLFTEDMNTLCRMSEKRLQTLLNGMELGVDVHVFLRGSWTDEQVSYLVSFGKSIDGLLGLINSNFSYDLLTEIVPLYREGKLSYDDIRTLCAVDDTGYPIYNLYQVSAIGNAIKDGVVVPEMYNPNLSDMDIIALRKS